MSNIVMNIRIENLPLINRRIGRIDERFKNMSIMKFAREVRKKAIAELRKGYVSSRKASRTGELESSIKVHSIQKGKEAIIIATAPHANIIEYGRGPVTPVKKKMLRFVGYRGEYVFTKKVRATKPVRFMEKSRRWAKSNMRDYISKRVSRLIKSGGDVGDVGVSAIV